MNGAIYGIIKKNGKIKLIGNCLEEETYGIRDSESPISYMVAVLSPKNGKWWLSPKKYPGEWEFRNSSHPAPVWFQKKKYEEDFRKTACHWWTKHVLYRKDVPRLSGGTYLLKDCQIGEISGNTHFVCCDTFIQTMRDTATAKEVRGRSCIDIMVGQSRIEKLNDYSFVRMMQENASIENMNGKSTVESMIDHTSVDIIRHHSRILSIAGQAGVRAMYHQSLIYELQGECTVSYVEHLTNILSATRNIKIASSFQLDPAIPFN